MFYVLKSSTHSRSASLGPLARPELGPVTFDLEKIDKNLSSFNVSNITDFAFDPQIPALFEATGTFLESV